MRAVLVMLLAMAALVGTTAQPRDAVIVLGEMRRALGAEALLDGLSSLSMTAAGEMSIKGQSMEIADEYYLLFPDHYLRLRRLIPGSSAYSRDDLQMTDGFRGDQIIRAIGRRRIPPPVPSGDRLALAKSRHNAARLLLALTGRSMPSYPLAFTSVGKEETESGTYEVVEARNPDAVVMRLYVDAATHLPAMVESTGLEQTPPIRWFVSEFKKTDGLNWPRHLEEQAEGGLTETLRITAWKVNPRIDRRIFDPIRR